MNQYRASRPAGVSFVGILTLLQGLFNIGTGILLLPAVRTAEIEKALGTQVQEADAQLMSTMSWVSIILGVVTLLLAVGLFRGNNLARWLVSLVMVVQLLGAAVSLISRNASVLTSVVQLVLSLVILVFLWSRKASAFFGGR